MSKRSTRLTRPKRSRAVMEPTILRRKRRAATLSEDSTVPDAALNESSDERSSSLLDNIFESPERGFKAAFGDSCNKTPKSYSQFRGIHCLPTPESRSCRNSPLPQFFWADQENVWGLMNHKDVIYTHSAAALERHPALQPRMRTILLDWLIEVCLNQAVEPSS